MTGFFYDTSKLKREFTEQNLSNYGQYMAECLRCNELHKDGWCSSEIIDVNLDEDNQLEWIQLHLRWGLDEEGYKQEWYETIEYTEKDFYDEFDKNFPNFNGTKLEVVR